MAIEQAASSGENSTPHVLPLTPGDVFHSTASRAPMMPASSARSQR
jgi:hypothetical protein